MHILTGDQCRIAAACLCLCWLACGVPRDVTHEATFHNFTTGAQPTPLFGVHEVSVVAVDEPSSPWTARCDVQFRHQSDRARSQTIRAFYDGGRTWRARLYVTATGVWEWAARCPEIGAFVPHDGTFDATPSDLHGMLRRHPENPHHWMTDDGQWFLNVGDTAYRLFSRSEDAWQQYLRDDQQLGISFVRAGAFGGWEWDRQGVLDWLSRSRTGTSPNNPWSGAPSTQVDLEAFRTTDERLEWMLDNCPEMVVELIVFGLKTWGKDDTGLAWQAIPLSIRKQTMDYILARFAAFPSIAWQVVNDMHVGAAFPNNRAFAREAGRYFLDNDPWHHPFTIGLNRSAPFPFADAADPLATFIHLEGSYELGADTANTHVDARMPIVMAEDHYEQDRFSLEPKHPNYYYRWLFWSWLLNGGSAVYGSRFFVLQPYTQTPHLRFVNYYSDATDGHTYDTGLTGLNSARWIRRYFSERYIELWRFSPDDRLARDLDGRTGRRRPKVMRAAFDDFLVYHPNAAADGRDARPADGTAGIELDLTNAPGTFETEWYRPGDGIAAAKDPVIGGRLLTLRAPWSGTDVVLRLERTR